MALAPRSPRLPSPPPPAEIQMSPNPPSGGAPANPDAMMMEQSVLDANSKRRIHPGTKAADMAAGPPLVPLSEVSARDWGIVSLAFVRISSGAKKKKKKKPTHMEEKKEICRVVGLTASI